MDFQVFILRFRFTAVGALRFPESAANLVRGGLGASLLRNDPDAYNRLFSPRTEGFGPSGFARPPRPFVLRTRHLDGIEIPEQTPFEIGVNLFDRSPDSLQSLATALAAWNRSAKFAGFEGGDSPQHFTLFPSAEVVRCIRVRFLTPTELKGVTESTGLPDFRVLAARVRDRISTLSNLYGTGPLPIDFRAFAQRAGRIQTISGSVREVVSVRRSRATGQTHSIGGFVGHAVYQGDLTEFLPYLDVAAFTGVGRQTVWGKGEIQTERVD